MRRTLIILALSLAMSTAAHAEEPRSATEERSEAGEAGIAMDCETGCDFESFKTQLNAWTKGQGIEAYSAEKLRELFGSIDKDNNQRLDPIEIKELHIKISISERSSAR